MTFWGIPKEEEERIMESICLSRTTLVDWEGLERRLGLRFNERDRRDLLYALARLASQLRLRDFEESDGKETDIELAQLSQKARELEDLLTKVPDDLEAFVDRAARGRDRLRAYLVDFADGIEFLMAPKRGRGRPRMIDEEVFALKVQGIWRRAGKATTKGASYRFSANDVEGPAVEIADSLLKAAGLDGSLPKVKESLRKAPASRSQTSGSNPAGERVRKEVDEFFEPASIEWLIYRGA